MWVTDGLTSTKIYYYIKLGHVVLVLHYIIITKLFVNHKHFQNGILLVYVHTTHLKTDFLHAGLLYKNTQGSLHVSVIQKRSLPIEYFLINHISIT